MANNYTVVLNAKINEASLLANVNSLANKYTLMLKGALASVAGAAGVATGGVGAAAGGVATATNAAASATQNLAYTSSVAQTELRKMADGYRSAGNVVREYTDTNKQLVRVVGEYKGPTGDAITQTSVWSQKTQALNNTFKTTANDLKNTANRTKDFTQNIENNIGKVIQWAIATAMIYGSLKKIQEGIQYITELNKSLTNISIVTGMTREQTNALGLEYNKLAQQMGVSTKAVADGSLEWFRQGKTIEQTTELMKSSLMIATLGNMTAADATEKLTATLNGFQMQANESVSVVDRLVALDNAYATSVNEIATAMQYSAAVSKQAGVSFNELASYISVISSVTRMSAMVSLT